MQHRVAFLQRPTVLHKVQVLHRAVHRVAVLHRPTMLQRVAILYSPAALHRAIVRHSV